MPMTSAAFIIFTLYMIPDPATTPLKPSRQALFGFAVAVVYGVIQTLHLVFGLFYALLIVCRHPRSVAARPRPAAQDAGDGGRPW